MAYTYEQLKDMTVANLREIAKDIQPAIEGYTTMHKDHLLPAMCKSLGIHIHHAAQGAEKTRIKATITKLKARREEAMGKGDHAQLALAKDQIHTLKRRLRHMAKMA
jgi:protein-arginine kinase activator protein McsA